MSDYLDKGEFTEEILRNYFLGLGYFAIRSVKFKYENFDVTDVDLFLYNRSTAFSREKIIVDIKNKKTPQAIERIFWVKGLQYVLGADKAMVATTDHRDEVAEFGKQNGVMVLDGKLLSKIKDKFDKLSEKRIIEEHLLDLMKRESIGDLFGNWRSKYEDIKSLFIKEMNFNTCNKMLKSIKEAFDYHIISCKNELSFRLLYLYISYFMIAFDFSVKDYLLIDEEKRKIVLDMSFKYGQNGFQRTQEILKHIQGILSSMYGLGGVNEAIIKEAVEKDLKDIKSEIISEYFCKQVNVSRAFEIALCFEKYAYSSDVPNVNNISQDAKSILALMCDFFSIERRKIL
jgi:hypothetical protein